MCSEELLALSTLLLTKGEDPRFSGSPRPLCRSQVGALAALVLGALVVVALVGAALDLALGLVAFVGATLVGAPSVVATSVAAALVLRALGFAALGSNFSQPFLSSFVLLLLLPDINVDVLEK